MNKKTKKIIIFGSGELADVAGFYFQTDTNYDVAAYSVDGSYIDQDHFRGRPLVAFEHVENEFPPQEYDFFVALGFSGLNELRKTKYLSAKSKGYGIPSYISSRATILNGGQFGENCFVLEDNTVQPFAEIGNNVVLWSGNHIGHHSRIGDHCFLASHIVVSGGVKIGESCFIGVNATLRDHIRIGEKCVIGAGALILADAEKEGVYLGPATERSRVPSTRLRRI